MPFDLSRWTRAHSGDLSIYLRGDGPDWFVPNAAGEAALRALARGDALDPAQTAFLARLPDETPLPYAGRRANLALDGLKELWLHLTDQCNLACGHCLFGSSPTTRRALETDQALRRLTEAKDLGCRVFALTGGEPFLHPGFVRLIDAILDDPQAHAVVLTNGTLFSAMTDALRRWPRARLHFQVSLDGLAPRHDALRGPGAFDRLLRQLATARELGYPLTLSCCPTRDNIQDLPGLVEVAAAHGAANLHLMWRFEPPAARTDSAPLPALFPPVDASELDALFTAVTAAAVRAEALGVALDNLAALRGQVFAAAGTRHDGSSAGWDSAAIGPDDRLYPSAALVGVAELATPLERGLGAAWRESEPLGRLRQATCADSTSPWRLLLGGGDADHSYRRAGTFTGDDPYLPLLERLAAWLIAREAALIADPRPDRPALRLKMGETHEVCHAQGEIALTRSNCLLALAGHGGLDHVKSFYAEAAVREKPDILNPVHYPLEMIDHIPEEHRVRGYGCGSPVADARLAPGETVLDLGCGAGVECLIAARLTGPAGRVFGLDMLPPMLARAAKAAEGAAARLGYANVHFLQGYLETLPLADGIVHCAISNCVLNLSGRKRRLFAEIRRVLRPGGRLVFSDVVCETPPGAAIRNDPTLRGECIGGVLTQRDLVGILEESGFTAVRIIRRFPYRVVRGHSFFSATVEARRPEASPVRRRVIYRGPFRAALTHAGDLLPVGQVREVVLHEADLANDSLLLLDEGGETLNPAPGDGAGCCCQPSPAATRLLASLAAREDLVPLSLDRADG